MEFIDIYFFWFGYIVFMISALSNYRVMKSYSRLKNIYTVLINVRARLIDSLNHGSNKELFHYINEEKRLVQLLIKNKDYKHEFKINEFKKANLKIIKGD